MIVLRLLAVFIVAALLSGCDPELKNDVKALKADIEEFKKDVKDLKENGIPALAFMFQQLQKAQARCKPPGQKTASDCWYKLQIIKAMGDSQYQGKVPDDVVTKQNQDCRDHSPFPRTCPTTGNTGPFTFVIDGSPTFKEGDVIECNGNDPPNVHLQKCHIPKT